MFWKALVGGVVVIALMSVSPTLGGLAFFIAPVVIVIMTNREEKAEHTAKWGYSPIREDYNKLSPERKKIVDNIRLNEHLDKDEHIVQITRRANENTLERHIGNDPDSMISNLCLSANSNILLPLESFQKIADNLPSHLGNELMNAARKESRSRAGTLGMSSIHIGAREADKAWGEARTELDSVAEKCRSYIVDHEKYCISS